MVLSFHGSISGSGVLAEIEGGVDGPEVDERNRD